MAAILGLEWLGFVIKQCPVLAVFCEDDEDELHRRLDSIVTFYSTERLRLISLVIKAKLIVPAGG